MELFEVFVDKLVDEMEGGVVKLGWLVKLIPLKLLDETEFPYNELPLKILFYANYK